MIAIVTAGLVATVSALREQRVEVGIDDSTTSWPDAPISIVDAELSVGPFGTSSPSTVRQFTLVRRRKVVPVDTVRATSPAGPGVSCRGVPGRGVAERRGHGA